jgi:hypothetical protein
MNGGEGGIHFLAILPKSSEPMRSRLTRSSLQVSLRETVHRTPARAVAQALGLAPSPLSAISLNLFATRARLALGVFHEDIFVRDEDDLKNEPECTPGT